MVEIVAAAARAGIGAWATINHYLVHWPRLRVGVAVVIGAAALAAVFWLLGRRFGRGWARSLDQFAGAPGLVFTGTLLVLIASGGGHLYTPDEWILYATSAGLVNHGVPAAFPNEPYPLHHVSGPSHADPVTQRTAWVYPKYGVLPALLAAPIYAVARFTGPGPALPPAAFPYGNLALPLVPLLLNPVLTAGTAALLYAVARRLGYARHAALIAAGSLVFGSLAWPYSKTLMNMVPAACALLLAFWALLRAQNTLSHREAWWLGAAGASLGLAIATRYEIALLGAPLAAWALLTRPVTVSRGRAAGAFLLGIALMVGPLVLGANWIKTGSPFSAGYGGEGGLTSLAEKPWYGWFGLLLSPGCGLVSYTPLMALGLVGLIWQWEDAPRPTMVTGAVVLLALGYYGSLNTWCGSLTWGPRYLVTVGPFLALPLAALWQRVASGGRNPFVWLIGGPLLAWSAATNALAVLIDFNRGWQDNWANELTHLDVTWLPYFTLITTHTRLLRQWFMDGLGGLDLYLWHQLGPLGPVVTGLLVATGCACWLAAWRSADREPETVLPRHRDDSIDVAVT